MLKILFNQISFENIINSEGQRLSSKMIFFITKFSGPILTISLICLIEVLYSNGIEFTSNLGAFALLILYSIFFGGFFSGMISAIIAMAHHFEILFVHYPHTDYFTYETLFKLINVLILFSIALMAGINQKVVKQKIKALREAEIKLQESEELYRKLVEFSPYGVFIQDEGRITYANHAGLNILGASESSEIIGKHAMDLVHPDCMEIAKDQLNSVTNYVNAVPLIEQRLLKVDGTSVDVEIAATSFSYKNKKAILGIIKDITKRKQAELSLQGSERKFQTLFNNMNDAIFIHESVKNNVIDNFIEVNDVACKMLGYSRDELLNKTPYSITVENESVSQNINEVLAKGHHTFEMTLISKDGILIPVEMSSHCFHLNGRNIIQSLVRNITDRKITEDKLRRSEERYRQLVELSPEAIIVHMNGKITFVNNALLNLLGVSSKFKLIGNELMNIIHPDYHQVVTCRINKMYDGRSVKPLRELQLLKVDGTPVDVEITSAPLPLGDSFGALALIRDISERKLAVEIKKKFEENNLLLNKAIESERLKTEFFINISHEFKTPLNVILSALQLSDIYIKKQLLNDNDGKQERRFNIMKQNCNRLLRLVNNLIDITKIDSGYLELSLRNSNIVSVIEEITLSVAQYIENKGINLEFDTEVEEKFSACDPDKIERILLNLLSNAVKFTQPGGSIKVNIFDKKETIIISVKDSGVGIPSDKQAIIFERFRQVDQSLTRMYEGSGIGLSLVKSLVELHGGKISLESEYGKGSNFIIELPVNMLAGESHAEKKIPETYENRVEKVSIEFSDIYGIT